YEKKETKKPALCHLSKGGFCSRARLKISKGQVVFFEKITQKISTFKPLPIFILSVLSSLPKARLSKNKIFIDRKSTRLNSSHVSISYAVFCLKKKKPATIS